MNLRSEEIISLTKGEAKLLWEFLNYQSNELSRELNQITLRLESALWDALSLEEMHPDRREKEG